MNIMTKEKNISILQLSALFLPFCVIGYFLTSFAFLITTALVFILAAGLIFTLNKKYWEYYGIPVVGLITGYIIRFTLL
jgi:hypothetical protein